MFQLWRLARAATEPIQDMDAARVVFQKLSSKAVDRNLRYLRAHRPFLLEKAPCLQTVLEGQQWPPGSLGHAYHAFRQQNGLGLAPAAALVPKGNPDYAQDDAYAYERGAAGPEGSEPDTERRWLIRRFGVAHDLWHVLLELGIDPRGEALLAAWTFGVTRDLGNLLFALSSIQNGISPRDLWCYWRRGCRKRRAALVTHYEACLDLPLFILREQFA